MTIDRSVYHYIHCDKSVPSSKWSQGPTTSEHTLSCAEPPVKHLTMLSQPSVAGGLAEIFSGVISRCGRVGGEEGGQEGDAAAATAAACCIRNAWTIAAALWMAAGVGGTAEAWRRHTKRTDVPSNKNDQLLLRVPLSRTFH